MSATLIAVLLALFLGHVATPLARLRRLGWFERWLGFGQRHLGGVFAATASILLSLGLPLLVVGSLQAVLQERFFGLPAFAFALLMLLYCWGPRDLDIDVEAIEAAPDEAARQRAIAQLAGDARQPASDDEAGLVLAVFAGARRRWFGVLLWFLLLGPFGALLYRLAVRGAGERAAHHLSQAHATAYRHLLAILDWPVAHLMTLALAVAGSFDAVHAAWRGWHAQRRGQGFDFSIGFLDAAALSGVRQYQRDRAAESALDGEDSATDAGAPADAPPTLTALHAAMTLVWRILVTWIVVLAVLVLAGYV